MSVTTLRARNCRRRAGGVVAGLLALSALSAVGCSSSGSHPAASGGSPSTAPASAAAATSVGATPGRGTSSPAPPSGTATRSASPTGFHLPVAHPTVWLCRPGMAHNPCEGGLDATVVSTSGTRSTERFTPASDPKVDCFYVYPTLSQATSVNAPLAPEPAAVAVTRAQAARFASVCRLYVPVYRQITLAGLASALAGKTITPAEAAMADADVDSAWHDYLDHDNQGRGVVLIGHSQGAGQLDRLIRVEVDRSPAEMSRLVSALVLGGNVVVPRGRDSGGDFAHVAACRSATQHGCVVAYSMFNAVPPANSLFGRAARNRNEGGTVTSPEVLCVNPAALMGGPAPVRPYLPTRTLGGSHLPGQAATALPAYPGGFVAFPGQLRATCRDEQGASWLQVDAVGHPAVKAPVVATLGPAWGLHLYDLSADQGDLIALVRAEAATWR